MRKLVVVAVAVAMWCSVSFAGHVETKFTRMPPAADASVVELGFSNEWLVTGGSAGTHYTTIDDCFTGILGDFCSGGLISWNVNQPCFPNPPGCDFLCRQPEWGYSDEFQTYVRAQRAPRASHWTPKEESFMLLPEALNPPTAVSWHHCEGNCGPGCVIGVNKRKLFVVMNLRTTNTRPEYWAADTYLLKVELWMREPQTLVAESSWIDLHSLTSGGQPVTEGEWVGLAVYVPGEPWNITAYNRLAIEHPDGYSDLIIVLRADMKRANNSNFPLRTTTVDVTGLLAQAEWYTDPALGCPGDPSSAAACALYPDYLEVPSGQTDQLKCAPTPANVVCH